MVDVKDFDNIYENKWCPGCGNFGILDSMKKALANLDLSPEQILLISGIGQAAKTPHFLNCNFFHTLHGRALPIATGAKIANHDLRIIVNSGDGDCYGEGGNHFMNAIRRNIDITLLVHDNRVYGLTKGQASPTSEMGFVTKVQNHGVILTPFNPLTVALSLGIGFLARSFSNDRDHLPEMIEKAIQYKGFSMIDILQPCVAYNRVNTHGWYKNRVYDLAETDHDPGDFDKAYFIAREWGEKIPIGVIYQKEGESYADRSHALRDTPLIDREYDAEALQSIIGRL